MTNANVCGTPMKPFGSESTGVELVRMRAIEISNATHLQFRSRGDSWAGNQAEARDRLHDRRRHVSSRHRRNGS
jgi:hypothetical protein